jgi:hypothetical protein
MFVLDPSRVDLALEFKRKPFGRHSADLQRVLNRMRAEPFEGHYVLVREQRTGPWKLAMFGRTPQDPLAFTGQVFTSHEEAEWAVFKLRWKRLTGEELKLE